MFCPNCGNHVPDQCYYCPTCATPIDRSAHQPAPQTTSAKKSNKPLIIALICVAAVLVVLAAAAILVLPNLNNDNSSDNTTATSASEYAEPNPEYKKVFTDNNIDEIYYDFDTENTDFFVTESDGSIERISVGYNGDTVEYMYHDFYYDISDLTEEKKDGFDKSIRDQFAYLEGENFTSVTYDNSLKNGFYLVCIKFSDLNQASNVDKMQEWQLVESGNSMTISMESTEERLLNSGYIKR